MSKYQRNDGFANMKEMEGRFTQPTIDRNKANHMNYQLNISNPNQCWQRSEVNTYRAPNKFEQSEIIRMKNKQRYNGAS